VQSEFNERTYFATKVPATRGRIAAACKLEAEDANDALRAAASAGEAPRTPVAP
jgi:hypothetical protein